MRIVSLLLPLDFRSCFTGDLIVYAQLGKFGIELVANIVCFTFMDKTTSSKLTLTQKLGQRVSKNFHKVAINIK